MTAVADELSKELATSRLGSIAELLENNGIAVEDIGKIRSVGFTEGDYQAIARDENPESENFGSVQVFDLNRHATQISFSPKWDEGPDWPVVQQAPAVRVKSRPASKRQIDDWKRAVILPDIQVGFRKFDDGTLDPFHDEVAIEVAMQILRDADPDLVVLVGDNLDLPEWSVKFIQEPAFAQTTQLAVNRLYLLLANIRANLREGARIVYIEGNHDRRLVTFITNNAKQALHLKQASPTPDSWPVMSVPHLLRLDELGVEYVAGYPAARYWINDNLMVIHGHKVKSNGSTASAVIDDERVSTLFGHVHRMEEIYKTRHTRGGPRFILAATMGTLARIDGAVPSTKGATDLQGRAIQSFENWQQGLSVVDYQPGDGEFEYSSTLIHGGKARWRGKNYCASPLQDAA